MLHIPCGTILGIPVNIAIIGYLRTKPSVRQIVGYGYKSMVEEWLNELKSLLHNLQLIFIHLDWQFIEEIFKIENVMIYSQNYQAYSAYVGDAFIQILRGLSNIVALGI
jgi:hypothetical protein